MLSAFNPHEMSEATVRKVATGREDALADVLRTIRGNLGERTMQHLILSAPRGYGKSFLMRHIQIEAERIAREEKLPLAVLLMPEEMPFVKLPETLIHELSRALTGGAASEAKLAWGEDEDTAFDDATRALSAAIQDKLGDDGLCVALVENFDRLLPRAFPRENQRLRLRTFLTEQGGRLMLIAASASGAFDRDYDRGLFQAFREVVLEPWSLDECLAFFARQREAAGKPPFDAREAARAKAVAIFIGGTPRLATMLGEVLLSDDVLGAAELLRKLVDELTPYYKERIEALPGRSQVLLDALLRHGEPATQSELTRRVGAGSQAAIAGPFHDLVRERVVVGDKASGSAEVLYRIADRVFAHYYRFRVIEHGKALCPLEGLVDLLADFFSPQEKGDKAAEFARLGRIDEARVMARLWDKDRGDTRAKRHRILSNAERWMTSGRLSRLLDAPVAARLRTIAKAAREGRVDEARERLDEMLREESRAENRVGALLMKSLLEAYEGFAGGLASGEEAVRIASGIADPKYLIGAELSRVWSLGAAGRFEEALAGARSCEEDAAARGDLSAQARALRYAAWCLAELSRGSEALETYRRASRLAHEAGDTIEEAFALEECARHLNNLSRPEEALDAAESAVKLAREAGDEREEGAARLLAAVALQLLSRHAEAIGPAERAAELAHRVGDLDLESRALLIAAQSQNELSRYAEASRSAELAADAAKRAEAFGLKAGSLFQAGYALQKLGKHGIAPERFLEAAAAAERARHWPYVSASQRFAASSFVRSRRVDDGLAALARSAQVIEARKIESEEKYLIDQTSSLGRMAIALRALQFAEETAESAATEFHSWLSAAEPLAASDLGARVLAEWLNGCVDAAAEFITVPEVLETLAAAIVIHFPDRFAAQRRRLTDAASYHRSGRARAALERLDPDFARVLATMHPPPADEPIAAPAARTPKLRKQAATARHRPSDKIGRG